MCLAIPMRLREHHGVSGILEIGGVRKQVMLTLTPEAKVGDWLVVHAGYALEIMDEQEVERTLSLLQELGKSDK